MSQPSQSVLCQFSHNLLTTTSQSVLLQPSQSVLNQFSEEGCDMQPKI